MLATTRDPELYCPDAPITLVNVEADKIAEARAQQSVSGCPLFLSLAQQKLILREPVGQLVQHYGQKLFAQLWTARGVRFGKGWVGFDLRKELGKPVHVINDAAMQALGSYHGGRMLFLGLGTGLGSALVWEKTLLPLELGDLPYRDHDIIENYLGIPGLELLGEQKWKREVIFAVTQLKLSFTADYVVLGGGNAHRFEKLPKGIEHGQNENAFLGGKRLWEIDSRTRKKKWRVL